MTRLAFEPGSFRDRTGRIFYDRERGEVLRALSPEGWADWQRLSQTRFFLSAQDDGRIIATTVAGEAVPEPWAGSLRHERVEFISYPYEWTFSMLKDAAILQLELMSEALAEDMILKDATPYNIQWRGASPTFIDIGSFARWVDGEAWSGYRQFCKLFLYPLMLQAYKDVPFQPWLRGRLEGMEPEEVGGLFRFWDTLRPGVFGHVRMQAFLQRRGQHGRDIDQAELRSTGLPKSLIERNVHRLRDLVEGLRWSKAQTEWSHYTELGHYSAPDQDAKIDFVTAALSRQPRDLVWDLGANTGTYTSIAAKSARYVIATDVDPLAVEVHYRALKRNGTKNVLPLLMDLSDPSPDQGWLGAERRSLAKRGGPDLVLCLALIHHIVIGCNVPLDEFVAWLAELQAEVVIEFVTREDPMVQRLLSRKREQYADYDITAFRAAVGRAFEIVAEQSLESSPRILFHLRPVPP